MVNEILTAAEVEYAQGHFIRIPAGTHAVYFDNIETDVADPVTPLGVSGLPRIYKHNVTIELYAPLPDEEKETAIEAELDIRGIPWSKQDRYWLKDLQRHQTVYDFSYTSKIK